jgi:hypothetical protein
LIYFYYASIIAFLGVITKIFLIDTNLGERFKNFDHQLLASDIAFICALILTMVGLILYMISKSRKSTLSDSTILISFVLIFPLTFILSITPLLQTIKPGEVGDSLLGKIFTYILIIGGIGAIFWIVYLVIIFVKQIFIIVTCRNNN